jgi:hypothetical protein
MHIDTTISTANLKYTKSNSLFLPLSGIQSFRTNVFKEDETAPSANEDVLIGLFKSSVEDYIKEVIKYIHYGSFFYFGLFQLISVMLYIHICCFVQGYADHLADTVSMITMSSERTSENRRWPSYLDCNVFDIRYIATLHQYVIG